jgi:hypothetical protein
MATAVIIDDLLNKTKTIDRFSHPVTTIINPTRNVTVYDVLPFRVSFKAIQIQDLRGMIPAIPLQMIGYSNYIL